MSDALAAMAAISLQSRGAIEAGLSWKIPHFAHKNFIHAMQMMPGQRWNDRGSFSYYLFYSHIPPSLTDFRL